MLPQQYHQVLNHFQANFRYFFSKLTDEDMRTLLTGSPAALLSVLEQQYGYAAPEAKAAWNEFVLRYVDGNTEGGTTVVEPPTSPPVLRRRSPNAKPAAPFVDSRSLDQRWCAPSARRRQAYHGLRQVQSRRHLC
jgi:hypothetical protein